LNLVLPNLGAEQGARLGLELEGGFVALFQQVAAVEERAFDRVVELLLIEIRLLLEGA